jgi:catalase
MDKKTLTTNQGVPVADNQSSLTAGQHGPVLLQDIHLIEKLAHFDRERIPERVVHAKGAGAHGYFQVYKSMAPFTKAKFLRTTRRKPRYSSGFRPWSAQEDLQIPHGTPGDLP